MKSWKSERNYRKVYNASGEIKAYVIRVARQDVIVSEEVFHVYAQMDAKERYQEERKCIRQEASIDYLTECGVPESEYWGGTMLSAEDLVFEHLEQTRQQQLLLQIPSIMEHLSEEDLLLIQSLYWEGLSSRQCAAVLGISQTAVVKRHKRILKQLHSYLCES